MGLLGDRNGGTQLRLPAITQVLVVKGLMADTALVM